MNIGYCRVSTADQNLSLQVDALKKFGCDKIYIEKATGKTDARPQLKEALSQLQPTDKLVIWKLDRLFRSVQHLIELGLSFEQEGIELVSITESLDTSTPTGRLLFNILAVLSQFESDVLRQRTLAGLAAARDRGRRGGRPKRIDLGLEQSLTELILSSRLSKSEIARMTGVSRATLYRFISEKNMRDVTG